MDNVGNCAGLRQHGDKWKNGKKMTWLLLWKQVQVFKHLLPQTALTAMIPRLRKTCSVFSQEVGRKKIYKDDCKKWHFVTLILLWGTQIKLNEWEQEGRESEQRDEMRKSKSTIKTWEETAFITVAPLTGNRRRKWLFSFHLINNNNKIATRYCTPTSSWKESRSTVNLSPSTAAQGKH